MPKLTFCSGVRCFPSEGTPSHRRWRDGIYALIGCEYTEVLRLIQLSHARRSAAILAETNSGSRSVEFLKELPRRRVLLHQMGRELLGAKPFRYRLPIHPTTQHTAGTSRSKMRSLICPPT
jgi:hypothetical protein